VYHLHLQYQEAKKINSVARVHKQTIPTERPPLVCKDSASFCRWMAPRGQHDGSPWLYSQLSRPELPLFLPNSSSVVLMRLSGPRSRPTTSQKIWQRRESNLDLWICSHELWPLDNRGGQYLEANQAKTSKEQTANLLFNLEAESDIFLRHS
jgi:hypothetical protein